MTKQLFIITYGLSTWCGTARTCVCAWSHHEVAAREVAAEHMEVAMRELFMYTDDGCAYSVNSVEILDGYNENWKNYWDPVQQANFYPIIGSQE